LGHSFVSYPDDISILTNVLRHFEHDHLMVIPKVLTGPETTFLEEEEDATDSQLLFAPVGSILKVDLEQSGLSSFYDLKASSHNSKSSAEKKNCRATDKGIANRDRYLCTREAH
jgi:hypothetical protein